LIALEDTWQPLPGPGGATNEPEINLKPEICSLKLSAKAET
jgi:hypothetical protein